MLQREHVLYSQQKKLFYHYHDEFFITYLQSNQTVNKNVLIYLFFNLFLGAQSESVEIQQNFLERLVIFINIFSIFAFKWKTTCSIGNYTSICFNEG